MQQPRTTPDQIRHSSLFRFRLTREGVVWLFAACVLLLVSWLKAINLVLLLAYLMLVLWMVNFFLAGRGLTALRVRRRLDDTMFAGASCHGEIEVCNSSDAVQYGLRFVDRREDEQQQWFAARLDPLRKETLTQVMNWPRRGRIIVPPLHAVSGYPFGLVQRSADLGPPLEVLVLPALGKLDSDKFRRFLSFSDRGDRWESHAPRRQPVGPAELHAIRPYHPGDSPHWIHWRTTARRGELMVREFEEESSENLVLIVDTWTPRGLPGVEYGVPRSFPVPGLGMPIIPRQAREPQDTRHTLPPTSEDQRRFEDVISLAATICWEAQHDSTRRITLVIAGAEPVVIPGAAGTAGTHRLLECLATAAVSPEYSHYRLLDALTAAVLPGGPFLVLGVEPEGLVRTLTGQLQTSAVVLRAADLDHCDFYEKP